MTKGAMTERRQLRGAPTGDVAIQCTYQNAFLQLWYVKTKKTWQLYKITTLVLKIILNS